MNIYQKFLQRQYLNLPPPRKHKRVITAMERNSYNRLLEQIELMIKYDEIENKEEFEKYYKIIKDCDLNRINDFAKKLKSK